MRWEIVRLWDCDDGRLLRRSGKQSSNCLFQTLIAFSSPFPLPWKSNSLLSWFGFLLGFRWLRSNDHPRVTAVTMGLLQTPWQCVCLTVIQCINGFTSDAMWAISERAGREMGCQSNKGFYIRSAHAHKCISGNLISILGNNHQQAGISNLSCLIDDQAVLIVKLHPFCRINLEKNIYTKE